MAQANIKAVITAEDRASRTLEGFGSRVRGVARRATQAFAAVAAAVTAATVAASKAAFEQVRAVENASFALRAYEKDGKKVNKVLSDLVAFARSDPGVLFQREDLFAAAQTLKLYGQTTDSLVEKVKILSRGVALGKTTFQELSQIVGRAAAKGRLDAVDFDMLIERGIGLDRSFRGAKISSEELFEELKEALPAKILEGRAKTIDGMMIRLKSAFRDLGAEVLGVDKKTTQFVEGGLGALLIDGLVELRNVMADGRIREAFASLGRAIVSVIGWIRENGPVVLGAFERAWQAIRPSFMLLVDVVKTNLMPALMELHENLKPFLPLLGAALVGAIVAVVVVLAGLTKAVSLVIDFVNLAIRSFRDFITTIKVVVANVRATASNMIASYRNVKDQIIGFFRAILDFVAQVPEKVGNAGDKAANAFINAFKKVPAGVKGAVKGAVPGAGAASSAFDLGNFILDRLPGRQMGGPVFTNKPVMVGERGPEVFVPQSPGKIIPNNQLGGGGGNTTININIRAGAMMGSRSEARKFAELIKDNLKDVARSRNMSVEQMMGA